MGSMYPWFFGFLRAGEFTVASNGNQALLSPADI